MLAVQIRRVAFVGVLLLCRSAYGDNLSPSPSGPPSTQPMIPPIAQPEPRSEPPADNSRLIAGAVLGSGVVAIAVGTFIALKYTHNVDGSQEDNLVGLGIACAGVPLTMIGTMLWFNLPQTPAKVSVGPSGVAVAGRF